MTPPDESKAFVWIETAIRNFKNVICLEITDSRAPSRIIKALEPMAPSLRKVEIHGVLNCHIPLLDHLSQISHLTLLDIPSYKLDVSHTVDADTYGSICGVISRSSHTLEGLKLRIPRFKHQSFPACDLLEKTNISCFPKLRSLSLEISSAPLEMALRCALPSLRPYFSSLRTLHLPGRMSDIPTQMPNETDNLFTILESSGIWLTEIQLGGICKPLLQYLLSYRNTLQQLILTVSRSASNQALAADFDKVLLQHQSSLSELRINAPLDDGWALGENNKDLLLVSLPVLETLKLPVFLGNGTPAEGEDYLRTCLDRAINPVNFPVLRWVGIDFMVEKKPSRHFSAGGWRCGTGLRAARDRRSREALSRLQRYRFPVSETHEGRLPILHVCGQDIIPTYSSSEKEYRYEPYVSA
ncbi:hypothetical protein BKA70DRAFT_1280548 [Coprinopsis sp. MPI-PUGE-AT-0042]|nr:hypothetical protein BKA70DRAFT_1280548 [Coprinopsis sp. MPI-PUGE-AT-0042]